MTISSTSNRNDYTGNGSTATYSFTFSIATKSDLKVTKRNTDNVETTLALTTDYTVTLNADGTGSITLVAGNLTSGYALTIRGLVALTQPTQIKNQGAFFAKTHEDVFDRKIRIAQQQQDEIDRSIKLPETVSGSTFNMELPADIVGSDGKAIIVNDDGDGFEMGPSASEISSAQGYAETASTASTSAAASQTAASTSATNAAASATTASTAATNASASQTAASTSATNAAASATTASTAATNASASQTAASTSATNAAASATTASTAATNAAASATSSANSAAFFTSLVRFIRPSLVYSSSTEVTIESGLYTGTSTDYTMLFPDGSLRTVTSTTYAKFNITRAADFSGSGLQSGLRSGLSEATDTWYAIYAVKCDDGTSFVLVGDTTFPSSVSTLDTRYGSNGWVYIGMIRNGDNSSITGNIISFSHSGETTIFNKNTTTTDRARLAGIRLATTTSNTLSWAYSSGSTGASIPAHIRLGYIGVEGDESETLTISYNDGYTSNYLYSTPYVLNGDYPLVANVMMDITKGVYAQQSDGEGLSIYLTGFKDRYLSY